MLSRLSGEFAQRLGGLEDEAHKLAGGAFNLGQPEADRRHPVRRDGAARRHQDQDRAWATDASVLEDLAAQGHELPRTILDWRQLSKLSSPTPTRCRATSTRRPAASTPRYALAATPTGRLSSTDPNLQNIPIRTEEGRKIRHAFIAEPGTCSISADYSQIELRLLAHIGDIPQLKKAFRDGLDIHAMTASEMFGVPVEGMPAEVRRRAKAINFGIVYGISAFGLANQLGIEREEAGAYIKTYFERFPGIRDYMDRDQGVRARRTASSRPSSAARSTSRTSTASNAAERAFAERAAINAPHPGRRRRHHPPRHDPHASRRWRRPGSTRRCCCRCTTNWSSRCPRPRPRTPAASPSG